MVSTAAGIVVFYHAPCADGAVAAMAASVGMRHGTAWAGRPARFVAHSVADTPALRAELLAAVAPGDDVFLLDYCGKPGLIADLCARAGAVHLLDHHKTALEQVNAWRAERGGALPSNLSVVLDMDRSGAQIAFDYFAVDKVAPQLARLVAYIQDNDLWRHALPHSREFSAGLDSLKLEFDVRLNPGLFDTLAGLDVDAVIERGVESLRVREAYIAYVLPTARPIAIPGSPGISTLHCLAVTVHEADAGHRSELGNRLAAVSGERFGPAGAVGAVVYHFTGGPGPHPPLDAPDSVWKVSLRAAAGSAIDTTPFAQHYGGGGHRAASAFTVPRSVLGTFDTSL